MTRNEHLAWAKERALEYLPAEPVAAFTSSASDLGKHEDLAGHPVIELMGMHAYAGLLTPNDTRDLIEGTR